MLARLRRTSLSASLLALLAAVALLTIGPLFFLFRLSFEDGASGVGRAIDTRGIGRILAMTIQLAVSSALLAVVLGFALAWISHRLPPGRRWLGLLPILPAMVPPVSMITGWVFLLSPRVGYLNRGLRALVGAPVASDGPLDIYTMYGIVFVTGIALTAFTYLFLRAGLAQINQDLLEAAYASGASWPRVLRTVLVPLLRPSLVYAAGTALLLGLGQFTAPLLLGRTARINVLTTEMFYRVSIFPPDYGAAASLALPVLVAGVVMLVAQRVLLRGGDGRFVTVGTRGMRSLGQTRIGGQLVLLGYATVVVVLPFAALLWVALSERWTGTIDFSTFTWAHLQSVLDDPALTDSIRNSVVFSGMAILAAIPIAYVASRLTWFSRHRFFGQATEAIAGLPLGIPAVVFGLGFLFAYLEAPFRIYGTDYAVVAVYVTLALPFALRAIMAVRSTVSIDHIAASEVCGAGPLRTTFLVDLPLVRSGLISGAVTAFIILSHEFSASLLVRSTRTQVMGTMLYDMWENATYGPVAVMALIMCLVTFVGLIVIVAVGGAKALEGVGGKHG